MKENIRKIIELVLMIILLSLIFSGKVFASEASLSVSPNSCNVGASFTVTVNMPQDVVGYEGKIYITYADSSKVLLESIADQSSNYTGNFSGTYKAEKAGNATVTVENLYLYDIKSLDNLATTGKYEKINSNTRLENSINIVAPNSTPPASNNSSQPDNNLPAEVVVVNFKDVNETMYVTEKVNMRQNCGKNAGLIKTLQPGTEVTVTGIGDKSKDGYSWSRISYDGETGYVISSCLTSEKPPEVIENTVANDTINNATSNNAVANVIGNNVVNGVHNIADELGAIPEVGLNVMTFIFVGSCIVCAIIVINVKRRIDAE